MEVGETVGLGDRGQGELGADGNSFPESGPEGVAGEKRGEEVRRTKFRTGRNCGDGLRGNGRRKVKAKGLEDGEVVVRRRVGPFETEGDRVRCYGREVEYSGQEAGQATPRQ